MVEDVKEERTCRITDWTRIEPCGHQTHSRNQRIEHIRTAHTPPAAQWSTAYRIVEKNSARREAGKPVTTSEALCRMRESRIP